MPRGVSKLGRRYYLDNRVSFQSVYEVDRRAGSYLHKVREVPAYQVFSPVDHSSRNMQGVTEVSLREYTLFNIVLGQFFSLGSYWQYRKAFEHLYQFHPELGRGRLNFVLHSRVDIKTV